MEANTESADGNDEKKQIYFTVIQNIQKTLELTTKLETNAKQVTNSLKSDLEDKLKKEKELMDEFKNFKDDMIAQRRGGEKSLSQTVLDDFEKETVKKLEEINNMRLSLLKTKMNVQKLEKILQSKAKNDEDLDMIGFEQLRTKNITLTKNLEDRTNEIEQYMKKCDDSSSEILSKKDKIHSMKKSHKDRIIFMNNIDKDISARGRELAKLVHDYNELQTNFKRSSNAVNNKIVHDHYVSSKEELKRLESTLENLKSKYNDFNNQS